MRVQQHRRTGFYPVCERDHIEPLQMLRGCIELLYFCDIRFGPRGADGLREIRAQVAEQGLPEPSFILGDALSALECLRPVDVFFQRRDSLGEGGSGLFLLGAERLPLVLHAIKPGGLIVTDGCYVGGWHGALVEQNRPMHQVGDRTIRLSGEQPWLDAGLRAFRVD